MRAAGADRKKSAFMKTCDIFLRPRLESHASCDALQVEMTRVLQAVNEVNSCSTLVGAAGADQGAFEGLVGIRRTELLTRDSHNV